MITFERFYKEFLAEAFYTPHTYRGNKKQYMGHTITHGLRKQQVVGREVEFFGNIKRPKGSKMLGVIGSGTGLIDHINQAHNMGFAARHVAFFEMSSPYFQQIADYYISTLIYNSPELLDYDELQGFQQAAQNAGILIFSKKAEDILPPWSYASAKTNIGNSDIAALIPKPRSNVNKPCLINAFLPLNGGIFVSTLDTINPNLKKVVVNDLNFSLDNISHIDYDVTTTPNTQDEQQLVTHVVNQTVNFFNTYPKLQSLVQVYSWQRALPLPAAAVDLLEVIEDLPQSIDYIRNNNEIAQNQKKDLLSAINFYLRSQQGAGDAFLAPINNQLHQAGFTSLLQSYTGTNTTMLSIASIRGQNQNKFNDPETDQIKPETIQRYNNAIVNFLADDSPHPENFKEALLDLYTREHDL